jgi:hypothetical protein
MTVVGSWAYEPPPQRISGLPRKQAKMDKTVRKQVADTLQGRAKKTEHARKWPTS